ncbi:remorin 4.2-like [Impatiens glandulifera]|uniref:remorin 4.2-like n=1 Tax=Impatiens glandulifera TaxID=253017 RepID=UPI001FB1A07D|nr:remorin 4.2-like [Impatiens glandulifera]
MLSLQRDHDQDHYDDDHDDEEAVIREIHALTPPHPPSAPIRHHQSSTPSMASGASSENFTSISREFNALVLAGSNLESDRTNDIANLMRIREEIDDHHEETNPLAIVLDNNNNHNNPAVASPARGGRASSTTTRQVVQSSNQLVSVQMVKREEVESKISAWQNAKMAKVNNRFKREDAVISGWENEQVQKASSWMKKVERRLEEKRAKAMEKMENDVAKAHRKAEERRASAEAKRGTKVARILDVANLMRTVGRAPAKKSFF